MANTGIENVITLKQVIPPCPPCVPTGQTKPNVIGDPDYIAPYQNLTNCPVVYNLDCPTYVAATGGTGAVQTEFTVFNSVVNNPAVSKVKVSVMDGVTEIVSNTFTLPHSTINYFVSSWTGLTAGSRSIRVQYLDSADAVLNSCPNLVTINVS
jgi:hypothetical protein